MATPIKNELRYVPLLLSKRETIAMSSGEQMKIAALLMFECHQKSCGNIIKNAKEMIKNTAWRGLLGLPAPKYKKLLEKEAPGMWHWDGNDLVVDLYSNEWEQRRLTNSEAGRRGGIASGQSRTQPPNHPTEMGNSLQASSQDSLQASSENSLQASSQTYPETRLNNIEKRREEEKENKIREREEEREEPTEKLSTWYQRKVAGYHPTAPATMENSLSLKNSENNSPDASPSDEPPLHQPPLPPPANEEEVMRVLRMLPDFAKSSDSELTPIASGFIIEYSAKKWRGSNGNPLQNWHNELGVYAYNIKKNLPPPKSTPDGELITWLRGLKVGLPDIDNCRVLPRNIDKAAHEAYNAIPDAPEKYGELLAAYYADKLTEDSEGKRFWRPSGTTFLENITDIVHNHAVRWGKYTGWIKRHKKEHPPLVGDASGQKTNRQYFFHKTNIE